jgi:hypothetical protein
LNEIDSPEVITALRERVKGKIDEKIAAARLPKAHRWDRPPTTTAKRFSPTTPQYVFAEALIGGRGGLLEANGS